MEQTKSSIGSIFGTIIILALIILGALYFWGKRIENTKNAQNLATDTSQPAEAAATIQSMNGNDDLDSIEADLNNTQTENLSAELH